LGERNLTEETTMSRTRRRFSAEQKAQIVRRHLAGKQPVSKLAEELQVQPSQIHAWVNQVLAQAEKALENPQGRRREEHPPTADFIVHWELRESMKEAEIELVLQKALQKFPGVKPRIISDNPPRRTRTLARVVGVHHSRRQTRGP
jgi:transposase-like protein